MNAEALRDDAKDSKLMKTFKQFVRMRTKDNAALLMHEFNNVPFSDRIPVFAAVTDTVDVMASASTSGLTNDVFDLAKKNVSTENAEEYGLQEETIRELLLGYNPSCYVVVRVLNVVKLMDIAKVALLVQVSDFLFF
jgi:hypothetical protein